MADRPNILLICTDQRSASAMSCAGNGDLCTPAMDRLAESGTSTARCSRDVGSASRTWVRPAATRWDG